MSSARDFWIAACDHVEGSAHRRTEEELQAARVIRDYYKQRDELYAPAPEPQTAE